MTRTESFGLVLCWCRLWHVVNPSIIIEAHNCSIKTACVVIKMTELKCPRCCFSLNINRDKHNFSFMIPFYAFHMVAGRPGRQLSGAEKGLQWTTRQSLLWAEGHTSLAATTHLQLRAHSWLFFKGYVICRAGSDQRSISSSAASPAGASQVPLSSCKLWWVASIIWPWDPVFRGKLPLNMEVPLGYHG